MYYSHFVLVENIKFIILPKGNSWRDQFQEPLGLRKFVMHFNNDHSNRQSEEKGNIVNALSKYHVV